MHYHLQMYVWIHLTFKSDPRIEMITKLWVNYRQLIPAGFSEKSRACVSKAYFIRQLFSNQMRKMTTRCCRGARQRVSPSGGACCTTGEEDALPDTSPLRGSGTGSPVPKADLILFKVSQCLISFFNMIYLDVPQNVNPLLKRHWEHTNKHTLRDTK